jgi:hypothetical protein
VSSHIYEDVEITVMDLTKMRMLVANPLKQMCERFDIEQSRDIDRVDDIMESITNE